MRVPTLLQTTLENEKGSSITAAAAAAEAAAAAAGGMIISKTCMDKPLPST